MNCRAVNKEKVEAPAFREKGGIVLISIGRSYYQTTVDLMRKLELQPLIVSGYVPMTLKMRGDAILISLKLWSAAGVPPVEVENNEVKVSMPGWDWNYTANALEIVNEMTVPMFQMIRKGPLRIEINGIFYGPRGLVVASDKGIFNGPIPPDVIQEPIFKYPAWKYPGKYADGSN